MERADVMTLYERPHNPTPRACSSSIPRLGEKRLVASAERGSEHPLAEAIVQGAQAQGLALVDATAFAAIAGHGIRATVDGRVVLAGNRKLMQDERIDMQALDAQAATLAEAGQDADVRGD